MTRTKFFMPIIRTLATTSPIISAAPKFAQPKILSHTKHALRPTHLQKPRFFLSTFASPEAFSTRLDSGENSFIHDFLSSEKDLSKKIKTSIESLFVNPPVDQDAFSVALQRLASLVMQLEKSSHDNEDDHPDYPHFMRANLPNFGLITKDYCILAILLKRATHPDITPLIKNFFSLAKKPWDTKRESPQYDEEKEFLIKNHRKIDLGFFYSIEQRLFLSFMKGDIENSDAICGVIQNCFDNPKSLKFYYLTQKIAGIKTLTASQEVMMASYQQLFGISDRDFNISSKEHSLRPRTR